MFTTDEIVRAEFRRVRREMEFVECWLFIFKALLTVILFVMLVTILILAHDTQNELDKLEEQHPLGINSAPRLSVEEEVRNYINSLPIPEVEVEVVSAEINQQLSYPTQVGEVQEEVVDTTENELAQKVIGMTPTIRTLNTSSYCPCEKCCGKTDGITASGEKATEWHTVAAGREYKIGTIIFIPALADKPNNGWFIVQDRGGAIKNGKLDIFLNTHEEALQYGRHTLECYVYEF